MLSLKKIAAVRSAVVTSLNPELKIEILCAPGSEYDIYKSKHQFSRKEQWNDIIGKRGREILSRQTLPKDLLDKVVALLPAVGLKMLIWAEYHEGTLRLTRDFSLRFLRYSHFTERGVVDTRKAAEDLMNSENLNAKQKYKIACIYFFSDHMNSLYEEIVKDGEGSEIEGDAAKFLAKPRVVQFWTSVHSGEYFKLQSKCTFYKQRIIQAVRSGCKPAVQCMWEKWKGPTINFVENATSVGNYQVERFEDFDWIIFRDSRYNDVKDFAWVPTDYYDDTYRFLFSKVAEIPQLGMRELDDILHRLVCCFYLEDLSSVLELYLLWPHQDHFLETATVMWECISGKTFSAVLLKICDYIEPHKDKNKNIRYGEENCCDYRHLLKEFWCKSPDRCKRYFFGSTDDIYLKHEEAAINRYPFEKPANNLLVKLFSLKKFTPEDEEIIRSVLSCTTNEEMTNLMSVTFWKDSFVKAMKKENFEFFDRFLRVCFQSQAKSEEFKGKLKLEDEAHLVCKSFLSYNKLNAFQSFIERISLTENELERLKFDLISSPFGKAQCWELIFSEGIEALERFISWFLPSEKNARVFKRKLAPLFCNTCTTPHLQEKKTFELLDQFRKSGNVDVNRIQRWKDIVLSVMGGSICEKSDFRGGKWLKVQKFASSMSSPNKIVDFKKRIYDKDAVRILASLINAKQWSEADKFCEWLELPESEMSRLKKKTLNEADGTWLMLHDLVFAESDDEAKKLEKIDAILRWHLTDTEAVLEFRDSFLREHAPYGKDSLHVFEMSIEKYLDELNGRRVQGREPHSRTLNDGSVKRESSTSSPPKKACLLQPRQENKQEAASKETEGETSQHG